MGLTCILRAPCHLPHCPRQVQQRGRLHLPPGHRPAAVCLGALELLQPRRAEGALRLRAHLHALQQVLGRPLPGSPGLSTSKARQHPPLPTPCTQVSPGPRRAPAGEGPAPQTADLKHSREGWRKPPGDRPDGRTAGSRGPWETAGVGCERAPAASHEPENTVLGAGAADTPVCSPSRLLRLQGSNGT